MDYIAAIELVKQRMREIGKAPEEYHFDVVHVVGTTEERSKGRIKVKAFNQYYYLINFEKYYGLEIISDTGYFNALDYTNNTILEFTGDITIQKLNLALPWSIYDDFTHDLTTHPVVFVKASIF